MDWAQFEKGVFLVNVLGIVYDSRTRLILIGRSLKTILILKICLGRFRAAGPPIKKIWTFI